MYAQLAISNALIAVAGTILVAAGMIGQVQIVAAVGACVAFVGLRGWHFETQKAKRRAAANDITTEGQRYQAESPTDSSL